MLARVLAGRDVEIDAVADFLDPTIRKLMPDPHTVTQMETAAKRIADAAQRGEKSRSSAIMTWTARHRRRCSLGICGTAGSIPSSTFPTGFSKAMARMSKRCAGLPAKAPRF